ncbi:hypothetical protein NUU61_000574 [Penicillium alfredii]|uniref:NAD(P)-binding protein n=1 Tax=Penicillium alfredii TaxID=1506179 RepID=A0A9W9GB74_9EURO|nr:uncharacterized protein NUU61_000574 [Penicillium alfredii]KAJ5114815.1 hypothetical protein NUU61_000574 [Penicillium alfredii]
MVLLSTVHASNNRIASTLPKGLVAVFVGATSGIGEYTLKHFVQKASSPRVYLVGRSQEAGNRIVAECQALNPEGSISFAQADVGLLRGVDEVCRVIKKRESTLNILFMTQGSLTAKFATDEDLRLSTSLHYYSRMRFIVNLLPLLENAPGLRRVVGVFAGGMEGEIHSDDLQAWKLKGVARRSHISAMLTLGLERMACQAPSVSFIHEFPGLVHTAAVDHWPGVVGVIVRLVVFLFGRFLCVSREEGSPVEGELTPIAGTAGASGGGVYSLGWNGENGGPKSEKALMDLRVAGMDKKLKAHTEAEFQRVTGRPLI